MTAGMGSTKGTGTSFAARLPERPLHLLLCLSLSLTHSLSLARARSLTLSPVLPRSVRANPRTHAVNVVVVCACVVVCVVVGEDEVVVARLVGRRLHLRSRVREPEPARAMTVTKRPLHEGRSKGRNERRAALGSGATEGGEGAVPVGGSRGARRRVAQAAAGEARRRRSASAAAARPEHARQSTHVIHRCQLQTNKVTRKDHAEPPPACHC